VQKPCFCTPSSSISYTLKAKGKIMDDKTQERIKALETALKNELQEKEFYLKHARRTSNALGKAMFETIAADEDEHYQRLRELHKTLEKEGKWPETLPLIIKNTKVKDVLKKVVESVDTGTSADISDMEAVEIAIDFETKGEAFYNKLEKNTDNFREKQFFGLLASMEREHRLSLEDTFEFFKDPEGWYRLQEGHTLDGA
jgi:rubrerythrin